MIFVSDNEKAIELVKEEFPNMKEELINDRVNSVAKVVDSAITNSNITEDQRNALVAFAFDCGISNLRKLLQKTIDEIPEYMTTFNTLLGDTSEGMDQRRKKEARIFATDSNELVAGLGVGVTVDGKVQYFDTLDEAYEAIENGGTITLTEDTNVSTPLTIKKSCTIESLDGTQCTISVNDDYQIPDKVGGVIKITGLSENDTVVIKNLTINSNQKHRGLYADSGNVELVNCTITGNKVSTYPGGVNLTSKASVTIENCTIIGNNTGEAYSGYYYAADSKDLWVGANAKCVIKNSKVGYLFANANSYSKSNKGYTQLDSGSIQYLYIEYDPDSSYAADFIYNGGEVDKIVTTSKDGSATDVEMNIILKPGTTYSGGADVAASGARKAKAKVEVIVSKAQDDPE